MMMDTTTIVSGLKHSYYNARYSAISALRTAVKDDKISSISIDDLHKIFQLLATCLLDENWSVVQACILLLGELAPTLRDVASFLHIVLPNLIVNLGNVKGVIRRSTLSTLVIFVKNMHSAEAVLNILINVGFVHDDPRVRQGSILVIPQIVGPDTTGVSLKLLLKSLIFRLVDESSNVIISTQQSIAHLSQVKKTEFCKQQNELDHQSYTILSQHHHDIHAALLQQFPDCVTDNEIQRFSNVFLNVDQFSENSNDQSQSAPQFGLIPTHTLKKLIHHTRCHDWNNAARIANEIFHILNQAIHNAKRKLLSNKNGKNSNVGYAAIAAAAQPNINPNNNLFYVIDASPHFEFKNLVLFISKFLELNFKLVNKSENIDIDGNSSSGNSASNEHSNNYNSEQNESNKFKFIIHFVNMLDLLMIYKNDFHHSLSLFLPRVVTLLTCQNIDVQKKSWNLLKKIVSSLKESNHININNNHNMNGKNVANGNDSGSDNSMSKNIDNCGIMLQCLADVLQYQNDLTREKIVTLISIILLQQTQILNQHSSMIDFQIIVNNLAKVLNQAKSKLSYLIIECLAVVNYKIKLSLSAMLQSSTINANDLNILRDRFKDASNENLPILTKDGNITYRYKNRHDINPTDNQLFIKSSQSYSSLNQTKTDEIDILKSKHNKHQVSSNNSSNSANGSIAQRRRLAGNGALTLSMDNENENVNATANNNNKKKIIVPALRHDQLESSKINSNFNTNQHSSHTTAYAHNMHNNNTNNSKQNGRPARMHSAPNNHRHAAIASQLTLLKTKRKTTKRATSAHQSNNSQNTENQTMSRAESYSSLKGPQSENGFGGNGMQRGQQIYYSNNNINDMEELNSNSNSNTNSYSEQYQIRNSRQNHKSLLKRRRKNGFANQGGGTNVHHIGPIKISRDTNSALSAPPTGVPKIGNNHSSFGGHNSDRGLFTPNKPDSTVSFSDFDTPASAKSHHQPSLQVSKSCVANGSGSTDTTYISTNQLTPLLNPERDVRTAIKSIESKQWDERFTALNTIRKLAAHHKDVLRPNLQTLCRHIAKEINSLRSSLSKLALITVTDLFASFGKAMEQNLEVIMPNLMRRAGEMSNEFLGEQADKAFESIIANISWSRSLASLLNQSNSKSPPIRAKVAMYLDKVVQQSGYAIFNSRDYDRFIKVIGNFLNDGAIETRNHTKRIIMRLFTIHTNKHEFKRDLKKILNLQQFNKIDKILQNADKHSYLLNENSNDTSRMPVSPKFRQPLLRAHTTVSDALDDEMLNNQNYNTIFNKQNPDSNRSHTSGGSGSGSNSSNDSGSGANDNNGYNYNSCFGGNFQNDNYSYSNNYTSFRKGNIRRSATQQQQQQHQQQQHSHQHHNQYSSHFDENFSNVNPNDSNNGSIPQRRLSYKRNLKPSASHNSSSANIKKRHSFNSTVLASASPSDETSRNLSQSSESSQSLSIFNNHHHNYHNTNNNNNNKNNNSKSHSNYANHNIVGNRSTSGIKNEKSSLFDDAYAAMNSSDWQKRMRGLSDIEKLAQSANTASNHQIVTILDRVCERVSDSNSKVASSAVEHLSHIVQMSHVQPLLPKILTIISEPLCNNIASANPTIRRHSESAIRELMNISNPNDMVSNIANVVTFGNSRVKSYALPKLNEALFRLKLQLSKHNKMQSNSTNIHKQTTQTISKFVVPAIAASSTINKASTKSELKKLVRLTHSIVGNEMFATSNMKRLSNDTVEKMQSMVQSSL